MSEKEETPFVDPNSGASPQPGGFTAAPVDKDSKTAQQADSESKSDEKPAKKSASSSKSKS